MVHSHRKKDGTTSTHHQQFSQSIENIFIHQEEPVATKKQT